MLAACRYSFPSLRHLSVFSAVLAPVVIGASSASSTSKTYSYRFLAARSHRPSRFGLRRAQLSVGPYSPGDEDQEPTSGDLSSSNYQWVKVYCSSDVSDTLSEALLCFGASSVSMDELGSYETSKKICITSIFLEEKNVRKCISTAADSIGLLKIPTYEITSGQEYDWTKNALENFYPIEVTKGLWIVPQWRKPPDSEAVTIILNPGLAFGTGEHPTTKLCLLLLHKLLKRGHRFLDIGTGSGILAIAAVKMGASLSVGVDVDPQAITAAKHNMDLNKLHPEKMELYLVSEKVPPVPSDENICSNADSTVAPLLSELKISNGKVGFDIVIANILLNPLMALADDIVLYAKPGAIIGLSGILSEQVPEIENVYSQYLDDISVSEMDGWACLSGLKKS